MGAISPSGKDEPLNVDFSESNLISIKSIDAGGKSKAMIKKKQTEDFKKGIEFETLRNESKELLSRQRSVNKTNMLMVSEDLNKEREHTPSQSRYSRR